MPGTGPARLQHQLDRHQHGVQAMLRDGAQHLGHDPVTALATQQGTAQLLQRVRHLRKGRTVAQRARLALHQRHVVLPVVHHTVAVDRRAKSEFSREHLNKSRHLSYN